ncbi:ABC transporter ATP-binding protein, partial [bacterium]
MTPLLQIKNITHFFGGLCAVNDFNLALEKGELVGIIGPNGAGKTTIFNLITGVYKATRGSIQLGETELVGRKPNAITNLGIARTFQNIRLFKDLTVLDNVRIACYGQVHTSMTGALLGLPANRREEERISDQAMD